MSQIHSLGCAIENIQSLAVFTPPRDLVEAPNLPVGERVRQLREKRGWSQEGFAHEGGPGRSFAGAIERGEKDIRLSTLTKLSKALGVSPLSTAEGHWFLIGPSHASKSVATPVTS